MPPQHPNEAPNRNAKADDEEFARARMEKRLKRAQSALQKRGERRAKVMEEALSTGAYVCRDVPGYDLELRSVGGRELVVMFSAGQRFSLYKHDFERDVLFVADHAHEYYVTAAVALSDAIVEAVEQHDYERVIFAGFSKGGFGALSTARVCAALMPERTIHVVAFSPQVQLHPWNSNLHFWSYGVLFDEAAKRPDLASALERFGDVSLIGELPNLCATVIYARHSEPDRIEAMRVRGPNAVLRTVEGMFHGTKFYFLSKDIGRKKLTARITKIYSNTEDRDLMQTKPDDIGKMVEEILLAAQREPTLNVLFGELMEREPVATTMSPQIERFVADVTQAASDFRNGRDVLDDHALKP